MIELLSDFLVSVVTSGAMAVVIVWLGVVLINSDLDRR